MAVFNSRAFVKKIILDVKASYWFVPSTFVVTALILAELLIWLDHNPDLIPFPLPKSWVDQQGDGARQTLATIASTVIGVAGVLFSMTLVAVSFAAGNFGPRLIGNFMRDRSTQVSFGMLLATFTFAIFVLRAMQGAVDEQAPFVPQYALLMAMILTVLSVFTMIYYVHHVPETINVSNIASDLGHRFSRDIRGLIEMRETMVVEQPVARTRAVTTEIRLNDAGYIQQMDLDTLFDRARENDWLIEIHHAPGTFVSPQVAMMTVQSDADLTDRQRDTLRGAVATGNARTEEQATPFLGDQMTEMVARALSPGFNDPFTAMNCLNWLHAGLLEAIEYRGGLKPMETPRVAIHYTDFNDLLDPYENCIPYTITDRMTRIRHLDLTRSLIRHAGPDHPQAERLRRLAKSLDQPEEEVRLF
ncbi:DUF2254 domain-containing protein [Salipiger sp. IMCC34102]|uniref:DUF2254 domain-containing protein n=1 Tax=Salipiger sp. IMCC34102 TaxID=2510647 RepID=UPI0013ED1D91|nr:DUF2254 domain-containing protein [Salipiger sp. IMCC34102]